MRMQSAFCCFVVWFEGHELRLVLTLCCAAHDHSCVSQSW